MIHLYSSRRQSPSRQICILETARLPLDLYNTMASLRAVFRRSLASASTSASASARRFASSSSSSGGRATGQAPPEYVYRRQTTNAALYLLSLMGAVGAGYALNLIIETPVPNVQYTLIDSARAKELQLANQPTYGSHKDYLAAIDEIRQLFSRLHNEDNERVSTDEADLESHGISDWSYHEEKRPTVVVWVESTEEVQEIVKIATKYRVPITPFSGGTSLEGHFSSVRLEPEHCTPAQGAGVFPLSLSSPSLCLKQRETTPELRTDPPHSHTAVSRSTFP